MDLDEIIKNYEKLIVDLNDISNDEAKCRKKNSRLEVEIEKLKKKGKGSGDSKEIEKLQDQKKCLLDVLKQVAENYGKILKVKTLDEAKELAGETIKAAKDAEKANEFGRRRRRISNFGYNYY